MDREIQGRYVTITTVGETARAFVPAPLPPIPEIQWSAELREQFERAYLALGRLDGISTLIPNASLILYMYVRKEAVLSSMIEGTQSSLSDLLIYEMEQLPGVPIDDVEEVSNYVAALNHGIRLMEDGLPICIRMMKEVHAVLLSGGRGSKKTPGETRKIQNWIGGTRPGNAVFVPPPPGEIPDALAALENYINNHPENRDATSPLLKTALVHLQFETIHPFLDGNGRLGRLLITLILKAEGSLQQPLLYLSLYFKTHRDYYYELLNKVRLDGDWESWLQFYAEAVEFTANTAIDTANKLMALSESDAEQVAHQGRRAKSLKKLHQALLRQPIATPGWLATQTGLTPATVSNGLNQLETLGIVKELTGKKRGRIYVYAAYIEILDQGNELP
jgi:Fic family protein